MIYRVENKTTFNGAMALIEKYINKATEAGGFNALGVVDADGLTRLSQLAEQHEDNVLKIMPLPVNPTQGHQH